MPDSFGPTEQALRDALNIRNRFGFRRNPITFSNPDIPPVERPGQFRPYPLVIGQPDVARSVDQILQIAPQLQGEIKQIQVGPTKDVVDQLARSNLSPYTYDRSNLLGTTDMMNGNVSINPRLTGPYGNQGLLAKTLVHELSHTKGYGEDDAYKIDDDTPSSLMEKKDPDLSTYLSKAEAELRPKLKKK